jgi:hypothetical protein
MYLRILDTQLFVLLLVSTAGTVGHVRLLGYVNDNSGLTV